MLVNTLISWKEDSSIGVPLLDDQHRGIIGVINTLDFFIKEKQSDYYLSTIFSMIFSYTKVHFSTEEMLMERVNYPSLKEHKLMHENLVRESFTISNTCMRLKEPEIYLDFLNQWWVDHIEVKDKDFSDYLLAQGLKAK